MFEGVKTILKVVLSMIEIVKTNLEVVIKYV